VKLKLENGEEVQLKIEVSSCLLHCVVRECSHYCQI